MAFKISDAAACREAVKDMERGWGEAGSSAAPSALALKLTLTSQPANKNPYQKRIPPTSLIFEPSQDSKSRMSSCPAYSSS
jgi:hypothetical protein